MLQFERSGQVVSRSIAGPNAVPVALAFVAVIMHLSFIAAAILGSLSTTAAAEEAVLDDGELQAAANQAAASQVDPSAPAAIDPKTATLFRLYIGTYTGGDSKGIYTAVFNARTGKISTPELAAELSNPSFVAIHPTGKFLYSCSEVNNGSVVAFSSDPETGALKELNQQSSAGAAPCHIVVDQKGRFALVANYSGGNVAVLPIDADGKLQPACSVQQHSGSSVNKARQEGPHAHSINLSADNRFAFAADLGTDQLYVYKFDEKTGTLTPTDFKSTSLPAGAGPRHFAISPNGMHAFSINELQSTVSWFGFDSQTGRLHLFNTVSSLVESEKRASFPAEIVVHPTGRFVYCSNRGPDSISLFNAKPDGSLSLVDNTPSGGKVPRNFIVDPAGNYLLAANQESGSIAVFAIDQKSGRLSQTEISVSVGAPVCLRLFPIEGKPVAAGAAKGPAKAAAESAE